MSLGPTLHCKMMMVVREKARPKHAWKDQGEVWHKSKQVVLPYPRFLHHCLASAVSIIQV